MCIKERVSDLMADGKERTVMDIVRELEPGLPEWQVGTVRSNVWGALRTLSKWDDRYQVVGKDGTAIVWKVTR